MKIPIFKESKIEKMLEFLHKNLIFEVLPKSNFWKKIRMFKMKFWGQNLDFGHENSNIWYILESQIEK